MEIPMESDNGYSLQQQQEEQQWNEHQKLLGELGELLNEEKVIRGNIEKLFQSIFNQPTKPGGNHGKRR